ncbi:hypothetical protein K3495_g11319 [Podosphaera aphanis]|nr:hypothetical protein K3495_g11319 [Podosphaera aphanis]
MRTVPTGIALVAPNPTQTAELLEATKALQPLIGVSPVERQEKRLNYLLGSALKYGYNAFGARKALTFDEIRQ